jgi:hypothetical protein
MIEQRQREADGTGPLALSDRRVPAVRRGVYPTHRYECQPRQRNRGRHQESTRSLGGPDPNPGQPGTALVVLEGLLDPLADKSGRLEADQPYPRRPAKRRPHALLVVPAGVGFVNAARLLEAPVLLDLVGGLHRALGIETGDRTSLFYKDWGTGEPIVFVPGWYLSADM